MTIKTGDNVIVITGKDKGKTGKVTAVYAESNRVLVEGVNVVSKHQKPRSQQDKGGIIQKSAPINASNVMVVCPVCGKPSRIGHSIVDGKKVRVCVKCKGSLDKEFVKQTKKEAKKTIKAEELKGAKLKSAKTETKVEEKPAAKTTTKTAAAKKAEPKTAETKVAEKAKTTETKAPAKSTAKTTATKTTKTATEKAEKPATKTATKTTAATKKAPAVATAKAESEKKTTTKKSTTAKKEVK